MAGIGRSASSSAMLRNSSAPALGKTQTAAGGGHCTGRVGPQEAFYSTSVRVPAVAPLEHLRRDSIPKYRGFIPGVKAETVWGASHKKANHMAHEIRPHSQAPYQEVSWNCPPDAKQCVRSEMDVMTWTG